MQRTWRGDMGAVWAFEGVEGVVCVWGCVVAVRSEGLSTCLLPTKRAFGLEKSLRRAHITANTHHNPTHTTPSIPHLPSAPRLLT